ncbi:MAG: phosphoglucosamine mutase, partial [Armatimonadota bacterium]
LEHRFERAGIRFERADVGDRYVMERMTAAGASLGGEQSGHVLFTDLSPTGDGILTGLQVLRILRDSGRSLEDWASEMTTYPQILVNVAVADKNGWERSDAIRAAVDAACSRLSGTGRVNVRPSGTEPKIRVMVEAPDRDLVAEVAHGIADVIRAERGAA